MSKTNFVMLAAAAALATGLAGAASAADYQLRYDPAELGSAQGAEAVYARIVQEANRSCRREAAVSVVPSASGKARSACVAEVVAELVGKTNNPSLARVHAARTGGAVTLASN